MQKSQQVTLRYYSSKKPPNVLIEIPVHIANRLIDGHKNITENLFEDIRKSIKHASESETIK